MPPGQRIQSIASRRSVVEFHIAARTVRQTIIVFIQILFDLIVFIVSQSSLQQGHDLGQLVDLIQSSQVLNFFRADGYRQRNSIRDFDQLCIDFPFNGAGVQHVVSSIQFSRQHNLLDIASSANNCEDILIHGTSQRISNLHVLSSVLTNNQFNRSVERTFILIITRQESDVYREPYIVIVTSIGFCSNRTIGTDETIFIRHYIAFSDIHSSNLNASDMSLDRQAVQFSATASLQYISSAEFRQSDLDIVYRVRSIDGSSHLVLIQEHIDFITLSINQDSLLHAHGEFRTFSNDFLNSTFIEYHVHQDILMYRESHTDYRVVVSHISMFEDSFNIVFELLFHHRSLVFQIARIIDKRIVSIFINEIAAEEFFQSFFSSRSTENSLGFFKDIHTGFIQHIFSKFSKRLNVSSHRISRIAAAYVSNIGINLSNRHIVYPP